MGATARAIIGSSANMTGEMTVNTARGEGFKVSNLAASNAELAGNALGAGLGQIAGAVGNHWLKCYFCRDSEERINWYYRNGKTRDKREIE
ncbi:hypothetical protein [Rheinheimera texasensis]|uniref:hypothetical protein n=1 Tax=Rheinheimera texasensis TaxID=306205 RepID=UPI0004E18E4E|nr:hypothetical protein [Rheinheimera texasensis]